VSDDKTKASVDARRLMTRQKRLLMQCVLWHFWHKARGVLESAHSKRRWTQKGSWTQTSYLNVVGHKCLMTRQTRLLMQGVLWQERRRTQMVSWTQTNYLNVFLRKCLMTRQKRLLMQDVLWQDRTSVDAMCLVTFLTQGTWCAWESSQQASLDAKGVLDTQII